MIEQQPIEDWPDDQRWCYRGPDYEPLDGIVLPNRSDGLTTFRFVPRWRQRIAMLLGADVYVSVLTYKKSLQPLRVDCGEPDFVVAARRAKTR